MSLLNCLVPDRIPVAFDVIGELAFGRSFGFLKTGSDVDHMIQGLTDTFIYYAIVRSPRCHEYLLLTIHLLGWPNALVGLLSSEELPGYEAVEIHQPIRRPCTANAASPPCRKGGDSSFHSRSS
jgi:hypothetical protein